MSYCVHCGVELDPTAAVCPLCDTPVRDPAQPVDRESPEPFPTQRKEVEPVSRREAAIFLTVVLVSAAAACGVLNLFLRGEHVWSLYIIGAAAMLWLWLVPPLVDRKLRLLPRLLLDVAAVGLYVLVIALVNQGLDWYLGLALPLILAGGAAALFLSLALRGRSILTTVTLLIGTAGCFCLLVELFVDRFRRGGWVPGWSLVVLTICGAVVVPLIIVRRVPALREEARRRFHL